MINNIKLENDGSRTIMVTADIMTNKGRTFFARFHKRKKLTYSFRYGQYLLKLEDVEREVRAQYTILQNKDIQIVLAQ